MEHMDQYTILYQAKNCITTKEEIEVLLEKYMGIDKNEILDLMKDDSEVVRQLALKWLELGMKGLKYEYPPSVSRRMEKYYDNNKYYLAQELTPHVKQVIRKYKGTN